jgi:hypothetical protein
VPYDRVKVAGRVDIEDKDDRGLRIGLDRPQSDSLEKYAISRLRQAKIDAIGNETGPGLSVAFSVTRLKVGTADAVLIEAEVSQLVLFPSGGPSMHVVTWDTRRFLSIDRDDAKKLRATVDEVIREFVGDWEKAHPK